MRRPLVNDVNQDADNRRQATRATIRRCIPRRKRNNGVEDKEEEEEEIGLHMWENKGSFMLETPWFKF